MRITRAAEYAVRCILFICMKAQGEIVTKREIAREMDIPDQFLGKIAGALARAVILEIVQGARGGYRLLRMPSKISLLDVVEAIGGEIFLNDCIMNTSSCSRVQGCAVHRVWEKARNQLRETLDCTLFSDLLAEESCPAGKSFNNAAGRTIE